ncbi:ATP-dependent dethiobiotin synthetase BioD 1 [mine drainage metagenome]|uniref:ATP-dependent dethiobiotin synthetase BioD 1 n=1 Tax=mine drainage metagenome TaxID=410659 RepID=A0A1J5SRN5_9ZZZZ
MTKSYLVVGTDTNVGKTYVATALVQHFVQAGLQTVGMKPIASGCTINQAGELSNEDAVALSLASNVNAPLHLTNPYHFAPAIAPHLAAEQTGVVMDFEVITQAYQQLSSLAEVVIVEGAGGFFVPINATETLADLAVKLNVPIILVVGIRLGCINHALLTVEAIQSRGLTLAGWVANEIDPDMSMFEENVSSLKLRIIAPCLGVVRWQGRLTLSGGLTA